MDADQAGWARAARRERALRAPASSCGCRGKAHPVSASHSGISSRCVFPWHPYDDAGRRPFAPSRTGTSCLSHQAKSSIVVAASNPRLFSVHPRYYVFSSSIHGLLLARVDRTLHTIGRLRRRSARIAQARARILADLSSSRALGASTNLRVQSAVSEGIMPGPIAGNRGLDYREGQSWL